jgi:HK97 family phage major capsid protein
VAFGDFSYYYIADKPGIGIQRLNELYAANGNVGFRAFRRTDGELILAEAVKHLRTA